VTREPSAIEVWWAEVTGLEIGAAGRPGTLGSMERHGWHLSVDTDTCQENVWPCRVWPTPPCAASAALVFPTMPLSLANQHYGCDDRKRCS
jgi:hypothetical protein